MKMEKILRILFTTFIAIGGVSFLAFIGLFAIGKVNFNEALSAFDYSYISLMMSLLLAGLIGFIKFLTVLIEHINDN